MALGGGKGHLSTETKGTCGRARERLRPLCQPGWSWNHRAPVSPELLLPTRWQQNIFPQPWPLSGRQQGASGDTVLPTLPLWPKASPTTCHAHWRPAGLLTVQVSGAGPEAPRCINSN